MMRIFRQTGNGLALRAGLRFVNRELTERVIIVIVIVRLVDGWVPIVFATAPVVSIVDHANQESVWQTAKHIL